MIMVMIMVMIMAQGLDVSAVMNRGIHQVLFPGSVWLTYEQQNWGDNLLISFTASGGCDPILRQGRIPGASPCRDRGGHPSGRMLLLIAKTKAGIVKADGKGTGGGAAGGLGTIE